MKRIPLNYIYIYRWNTVCIVIEFRITTVCSVYRIEMNNENQRSLSCTLVQPHLISESYIRKEK